ncbi:CDP-diacylglycerol-choline O-phosphatidyltransferase [Candidatus Methylomirabilis lanthanidiphila]|uniref:Phosphatidylcholine synthase n=1 Tax=Candidatus Methylomirabilis lanthanidiphila TaxID=2211376 RepID=A0A564ZKS0_9BACT|nr:CDP-diacylglycerol-choline O-phosphatidyltransferase [Candidatus Methylomirabilis lanthanidiphila]
MWPQMMAWAVHLFTACGAVIGVWCLIAIHRGDYRGAFFGMVLAVVFDAVDGPLARLTRVKEILPQFDGAKLDDIVDYLNYVVVPIVLIHEANLLPASVSLWILPLPLLASAYRFCHVSAKTPDHFFTGFPSYWNILVFYYFVGGSPLWFNAVFSLFAAIMVLVPITYVYPGRTRTLRPLTIGLGILWCAALLILLWQLPDPSPSLVAWSLVYPIYYTALSFALHWRVRLEGRRTSSQT